MVQDPKAMPATMVRRRAVGSFYYRFRDGESGADVYDRVHDLVEARRDGTGRAWRSRSLVWGGEWARGRDERRARCGCRH